MFTAFCSLLSTGCVRLPLKTPVRHPPELPQCLSAQLVHSQNEPQFVFAVFDENNRSRTYDIFQVGLESYVPHEGTNKVLTLECHIPRCQKLSRYCTPPYFGGEQVRTGAEVHRSLFCRAWL